MLCILGGIYLEIKSSWVCNLILHVYKSNSTEPGGVTVGKNDHILKFSKPYFVIYLGKSQADW